MAYSYRIRSIKKRLSQNNKWEEKSHDKSHNDNSKKEGIKKVKKKD